MFDDPESLQYQTIANMKTIRFVLIGMRKQLTWGAVYEREADAMVEAFLPLDEVPKQSFSVPGDDGDEHDNLDNVEKWEIAKPCRVEALDTGNVSGIYVSADRKS